MNFTELKNLTEVYAAVYDQDLREEILNVYEDFSFVDDLSDNELDQIMESILNEGEITLSECYSAFDNVLTEATVTTAAGRSRRARESGAKVTVGAEDRQRSERMADRNAKRRRDVRVGRISQAAGRAAEKVKSGVSKASSYLGGKLKSAKEKIKGFIGKVKSEVSGEAGRQSKIKKDFRKNVRNARSAARTAASKDTSEFDRPSSVSGKYRGVGVGQKERVSSPAPASSERPAPGSFSGSERRAKAAADLRRAAKGTGKQGGVRFAGPRVGQVSGTAMHSGSGDKEARQKKAASFAKKAGLAEHLAYVLEEIMEDLIFEGYADNYDNALVVLESLSEFEFDDILESYLIEENEVIDNYDLVLDYLIDEGFADNLENAETIMVNMSEDWRNSILSESACNLTKPKAGDPVPYHLRGQISRSQDPSTEENRKKAENRAKRGKKRLDFEVRE